MYSGRDWALEGPRSSSNQSLRAARPSTHPEVQEFTPLQQGLLAHKRTLTTVEFTLTFALTAVFHDPSPNDQKNCDRRGFLPSWSIENSSAIFGSTGFAF